MRTVPEWVGKTPDSPVPARVKLRVWERHKGCCHIAKRKILAGEKWDTDHVIALCNGGENRETNLAPALVKPHREKTARDVAERAKIDRIRKRHLGIRKRSTFACSRDSKFKKKISGEIVLR